MAQTKLGALLIAAKKCGVTVAEYQACVAKGEKHCYRCRKWKLLKDYGKDSSRHDGRAAVCMSCRNERHTLNYQKKPRVSKLGERFAPVRDGDKKQARARVNFLIRTGRMAAPATFPCHDCGHQGMDRRHEYDHHQGYAADKHEVVQVVCTKCHDKRSRQRGELVQVRHKGRFTKKKGGSTNGSE